MGTDCSDDVGDELDCITWWVLFESRDDRFDDPPTIPPTYELLWVILFVSTTVAADSILDGDSTVV